MNIKERRKELNIKQVVLANSLGVTQAIVSKWENGVLLPTFINLINLAKALKVSEQEIVDFFKEKMECAA